MTKRVGPFVYGVLVLVGFALWLLVLFAYARLRHAFGGEVSHNEILVARSVFAIGCIVLVWHILNRAGTKRRR